MSDTPQPRFGLAGWALCALAFAVGFWNFPLRVVGGGEYLPGDDIDNPLNNFVLEHGYRYLCGREPSFWSAPSFYPQRHVTAWSDAHLGMLPLYAALRAGGLSPEGAFQGYFLIPFALNFIAAGWALRRLGFGPFGVAAGAYLFAFGLPLVAQLNHAQLFPRFLVPLAVVLAWEWLRDPRARKLIALAACVVGQIYLSVYIGYFLVLLLAVGGALTLARYWRELPRAELFAPGRKEWRRRGAVALGAVVALLPFVVGHARGASGPSPESARLLAPRPGAWVSPPTASSLYPALNDGLRAAVGEAQLFPGFAALAALSVGGGLFARRPGTFGGTRSAVAVAAATTVVLVVLVTRVGEVWLYAPAAYLPGSGSIRAVGRVVLVLLFPLGGVLAGGVDTIVVYAARRGKLCAVVVGAVALALVVCDHSLAAPEREPAAWAEMRYSLDHIRVRQQRIKDSIRRHPDPRFVYVFPSGADGTRRLGDLVLQLEALRAAQDLGLPCVNGWSGRFPRHWAFFTTYRELVEWLTVRHALREDELAGLVVVGEPDPDADPRYEAAMRARFPPQALP